MMVKENSVFVLMLAFETEAVEFKFVSAWRLN